VRRIAIIASASGNGKTTLGRALAARMDVPFIEVDAMVHGPSWVETPDGVLRAQLAPIVADPGWVIDGTYERKLGNLVLDAADAIVWLDLPMHVWLPRLARRYVGLEQLWNGNRETLRGMFWGKDSLFGHAVRSHFRRRRELPRKLAAYRVIRLRTPGEVSAFLASV
jgi:adenylate kinase family enzyme